MSLQVSQLASYVQSINQLNGLCLLPVMGNCYQLAIVEIGMRLQLPVPGTLPWVTGFWYFFIFSLYERKVRYDVATVPCPYRYDQRGA